MSAPREHLAAAVAGEKVYVIGGRWSDRGNVDTLQSYDPATDTWEDLPPMPTARGGLAAATIDGRIHVVGGESFGDGSRTFPEQAAYDPEIDRWQTLEGLPTARHGLAAAAYDGELYVIAGGETPGLSVSGIVERFQPMPQVDVRDFLRTPEP
jgi:N-acetylneuraminic acid mutarotase